MPRKASKLERVPLYPFLFALYPILALLGANVSEVEVSSSVRPFLFSILLAGILILVFYWIFHNWERAALLTTTILILFYSYGHVYLALKAVNINEVLFISAPYFSSDMAWFGCFPWLVDFPQIDH